MPRFVFRAFHAFCVLALSCASVFADDAAAIAAEAPATAQQEEFFEQRIRPILVARCFECHGEKKQEGGIRLDSRAALLKVGDTGPAIVVGKPEESRLIEVIGYEDVIRMPPRGKLPDEEIAALTAWIRDGAVFPGEQPSAPALGEAATPEGIDQARATHWAFQPIARPTPPRTKAGAAGNAIDAFILQKLEAAGIDFNPPADRRTLLRRVSFDLVGLPPTAEEVAAFENDRSPDAFGTVVDRLLASPQYGERWGRHWLDLARYADTKGYVFTEERKYPFSYTYRDYVIRALNNDLPFDRFLLEQIAADQLPLGEDKTALAAMGFLTLGRRFGNNKNDIIDDRIDVVMRGLQGMTVACARCHDHKFDPIPTDDYYSLHGIFASSVEPPELPQIGPAPDIEAYREYEAELQKRDKAYQDFLSSKLESLAEELRTQVTDYLVAAIRKDGQPLPEGIDLSIGAGEIRPPIVQRWKAYLKETANGSHPVFGPWHALSRLPGEGFGAAASALIAGLDDAADAQPRTNALVKKGLLKAAPQSMLDVASVYGKLLADVHGQWTKGQSAPPAETGATGTVVARATALPDPAAEELRQVLYGEKSPVSVPMDGARKLFDRETNNKAAELKRAVDSLKANSPAAPPRAMVMQDAPQPTQPKVFIRGNSGRPGKEVPRRFLQVLLPKGAAPFQQGSGRLELARAIASPQNPLTARVIVNRVWQHHFGTGLVLTPSDFGFRGEAPSHPELLDYLSGTFIDEGWSLKKLHRRILLSAVYMQTSDDRADGLRVDPENRLLWKMNRRRLEFEPFRDSLLAVAGRLDFTSGGRPVDLFATPFTTRRAVYGFIDRQDLPGTLRVFDFASPDVSTPKRPETTVPQQSLFGMNSQFVIEQAKHLAARAEVAAAPTSADRVAALYRLVYARAADADELAAGTKFLDTPVPTDSKLLPLEQYAQALLLANEFVFVD